MCVVAAYTYYLMWEIYPDNYTFAVRWVDRGGCILEYACGHMVARP